MPSGARIQISACELDCRVTARPDHPAGKCVIRVVRLRIDSPTLGTLRRVSSFDSESESEPPPALPPADDTCAPLAAPAAASLPLRPALVGIS